MAPNKSMQDIMDKLEGVVKEMREGFAKNQSALSFLTEKVTDVTDNLEVAHGLIKDLQGELQSEKNDKIQLQDRITLLENENLSLKTKIKKVSERAIDHENRNRRNCLELTGLAQEAGETTEQLENKVMDLFKIKMEIDTTKIQIENCHRFGHIIPGKTRPVIVRFLSWKMRRMVWDCRKKLQGSNVFLDESFAPEVKERRRILWPYMKTAWTFNTKAYFVLDKLIIDGKSYEFDKLEKIPDIYKPKHTKTADKVVLFFTKHSPLSNFYKCQFEIENVKYTSVQQYYANQAALFFKDAEMAECIMQENDAAENKRSFNKIKGFDKTIWYKDNAQKVTKEAIIAKFTQNTDLNQILKDTADKEIAEANPYDLCWGTGVALWSKDAANPNGWKGQNITGKLLMDVRSIL